MTACRHNVNMLLSNSTFMTLTRLSRPRPRPRTSKLSPRSSRTRTCPRGLQHWTKHRIKCFGEAPNTLHIYSVIGNGQNSKLLPLKPFVQNMQLLVKSVSSSFSKDLSYDVQGQGQDSTLKAKFKTNDFKIVLEDPRGLKHCTY